MQKTTPLNTPKTRISRTKGQSSRRTAFVREIAREVVGLAPYERRIIELLRNAQDKRARKLAKKRVRLPFMEEGNGWEVRLLARLLVRLAWFGP